MYVYNLFHLRKNESKLFTLMDGINKWQSHDQYP